MKSTILSIFVFIDVCSCFTNLTTLTYICKNFNIKTHVFILIFLDSLNSSLFSIISTVFDTLFLTNLVQPNTLLCLFAFLSSYLPNCFGSILTLLISLTRYILARNSAKNIQPSNKKVSTIAIAVFSTTAAVIVAICVTYALFDIPLVAYVEICAGKILRPGHFTAKFFLMAPNVWNVLALLTDIEMLKFLKKVIIPTNINVLQGLGESLSYIRPKIKLSFVKYSTKFDTVALN